MAPGMQAIRDSTPELKRRSRPRAKRAAIVGIPAFFVLAITGSASLGLIVAALIFVALYVPAWDAIPLGKWIVPLGVPDRALTPSISRTCSTCSSSATSRVSTRA